MSASSAGFTPHQRGSQQPPGPSKPTYSKRGKITIVACVLCRRRKTKCDGRRPACSQCQARDSLCQYDMNEEQRRLTFLRENVESLEGDKQALETVLWNLKNSSENESIEILRRIRAGTDPQALAQQIQASRSLTQVKDTAHASHASSSSLLDRLVQTITTASAAESDEIIQRLRRREPLERVLDLADAGGLSRRSSPEPMETLSDAEAGPRAYLARPMVSNALAPQLGTQALATERRAPDAHTPLSAAEGGHRWTAATDDAEFIEHLLDVYFMWQHSFFQNFPEPLFRQDFTAGRTKYCSRVLVNAICAAGCLLSDRAEARSDGNDPTMAGVAFFDEGMRLLNRSDRASIPSTAGLFLLSHVEGYRARLGAMWGLVGRSARMALDLNLHLRTEKESFDQLSPEAQNEETGRIHTFWGAFISDHLTLGRLPQLLTNAITVELPPVNEEEDEEPWGPENSPAKRRPGARTSTFRQCAALSKIVNSTLLMFFAPAQIIKGQLLLDEYQKYRNWYRRLPQKISSTENAPAHVLSLHMYYHAAVLLLFRPFLRAKFTESSIAPSDVCRQAATALSDLFAQHLRLYGATGVYTFHLQGLLAACTIHLINLPAISSAAALTAAARSLTALVQRNAWAAAALRLMRALVRKWGIVVPVELDAALYGSGAGAATDGEEMALLPPRQLRQRHAAKRPATATAAGGNGGGAGGGGGREGGAGAGDGAGAGGSAAAPAASASAAAVPKRQRLASAGRMQSEAASSEDSDGGEPEHAHSQPPPQQQQQPLHQPNLSFLFAPFPNQPAPLLGPIHTSTTPDPDLEWTEEEVRRVTRDFDGLRFEGDGWFDPFMGI